MQTIAAWRAGNPIPDVHVAPAQTPSAVRGPDFVAPAATDPLSSSHDVSEPDGQPKGRVADLIFNAPGQQLSGQIAAAHAAGERPTLLRRLFLGKHAYSTWERGAIGEQLVAEELKGLVLKDYRWGFLNFIPVGDHGADIDHLVIGPGGVFTVNSKYHRGSNLLDRRQHLHGQRPAAALCPKEQARSPAGLAATEPGVWIRGAGDGDGGSC
ncbi:nuclease-related domain-containing protein [Tessaracoccus terricola]